MRPPMMPADTPDYMAQAWVDCLRWAFGEQGIQEAFTRDTKLIYRAPRNGMERMIDEATGADRHFVETFIAWFNVNIWGRMDEPPPEES